MLNHKTMIMTPFSKIQSLELKPDAASETINLRSFISEKLRYFFLKRIVDIVISSLVIVLFLSWFLPIAALLIKLDSAGPVFFIQRRVGRWGRSFACFKFRTMIVNDFANVKQAAENDDRITRVGKFLRKTNLDEFPQFFNVFLGQMSLVGPRPHMHSDCDKFSSVVSGYKLRNLVKPGITGLAQVKGFRGPTQDFESIFHRYQFDCFYVRNAGFWLDLRIIRKTAAQTIGHLVGIFHDEPETITVREWTTTANGFLN